MTKMMIYDTESGEPVGERDIPDDVIDAAAKVYAWLRDQVSGVQLHGVTLAE